ncbi:cytosolic carboxypeptidase 2 [Rhincodon typus]|uniref:cytosolic carboxypeptidase 2 n=1 Tax=Rhincodon typus TaxID=259920 RepID=UPI002030B0D3|nr:cytosolic carboxypeptidase 2 [Rhincodon typus]
MKPDGEAPSTPSRGQTEISRSSTEREEGEEEVPTLHYSFLSESQLLRTRQLMFAYHAGRHIPRLREPLSLYAIATSGPQLAPRWPIECEVIKEQIHHIEWSPREAEKLSQPSQQEEEMPECAGEHSRTVVFCIDGARKGSYFTCSRVGGRRGLLHLATVGANTKDGNSLIFESRFESGNLQKAIRVGAYEYELTLRTDLYTDKHTQWYYFRVRNTRAGVTYRFTIVNLMKASSLYSQGLKPLLYSEQEAAQRQVGWYRVGQQIRYYKNGLSQEGRSLYSLTWSFQFPHGNDTCYFAHSYPYTYTHLQRYLAAIASDPVQSQYCKVRVLCRSLAGNIVHILTITSPPRSHKNSPAKKAVVVTARVHPGETNSSWVMAGFLEHLLGSSDDARLLRDMFIFKVVPMLNPDGVITGNYRCSLTGRDLNRNYRTILRDTFPCVWHTRNMVQRLLEERDVVVYCDFHGHSRKNNAFMYGCNNNETASLRFQERIFPLMMSKNAADKFSYQSCKFKVQRGKEGTGRIVMWRMGITHSYTMETTFAGSTLGPRRGTHFSTEDLKSLGYHFCDTLLDFCDPDRSKFDQCLEEVRTALQRELRLRWEKSGREYDPNLSLCDMSTSDFESSISGSDSSESDGPPAHLMRLTEKSRQKKKRLRTRKERNKLRQLIDGPCLPTPIKHQAAPGEASSKQSKVQGGSSRIEQPQKVVLKLQPQFREQIPPAQPWIPQPISTLSVVCAVNNKDKAALFKAMNYRWGPNSTPGQKYDQFTWDTDCSNCRLTTRSPQQQASFTRHVLPMNIVDQQRPQEPTTPITQHRALLNDKLECRNTLAQSLSPYNWKLGGLSLTCSSHTSATSSQRPQSTWLTLKSRSLRTISRPTCRSAAPHLGDTHNLKLRVLPSAPAGSSTMLQMPDIKSKSEWPAESVTDYRRSEEQSWPADSTEPQTMSVITEGASRTNLATSSDANESLEGGQCVGSQPRIQDGRGQCQMPVGTFTMSTASLVSMDTGLEQKGDGRNTEQGLSNLSHSLETQLALLRGSPTTARCERVLKLPVRPGRLSVLKGVSGRTAGIHQTSNLVPSKRLLLNPTLAGTARRLGRQPHRKSREVHQDSGRELQRSIKRNSLVETLKHQLSTVCLWDETEQSLHSLKPQNVRSVI